MRKSDLGATVIVNAIGHGTVVLSDGHDITNQVIGIKYERDASGHQQLWLQFVADRVELGKPKAGPEPGTYKLGYCGSPSAHTVGSPDELGRCINSAHWIPFPSAQDPWRTE